MIRAGIKRPHSPVLRTHFNAHSQYLHRGLQNSRIIRAPIFTIFLRRRIKNVPLIQEGGTTLAEAGSVDKAENCWEVEQPTNLPQSVDVLLSELLESIKL